MLTHLRPAIVLLVLFTVLCGIVYPLGITGIAQLAFPRQANGSLIEKDGKIVGSSLIGQNFTADKYFHSRPSATTTADPNDSTKTIPAPYNASNSSGSNLGPTSQSLIDGVKAASETLHAESPQPIPVDMVTASGSGLDPDITPAAARFQIARVAKARRLSESQVADLVAKYTEPRQFGFLGEPLVNVLLLNLALDRVSTGS